MTFDNSMVNTRTDKDYVRVLCLVHRLLNYNDGYVVEKDILTSHTIDFIFWCQHFQFSSLLH